MIDSYRKFFEQESQRFAGELDTYRDVDKRLFASSSFQSQSLPLLHLISCYAPEVPVVFLDTGYHFPETLKFRDQIIDRLGLKLINLRPLKSKVDQRDHQGRLLFAADPDACCHVNKVEPLEDILDQYDVWISGVRTDQSRHRRSLARVEKESHGVIRFHPMLDWDARAIYYYRKLHELPEHPLEAQGYFSIGCMPCTICPGVVSDSVRAGRWHGMKKTECGLHTSMLDKREDL